eukprot:TRINITY_DN49990_c0_g1_i1.p1 TRINITY_DN49990_c0_g1~~TRINITY_DN49990_c0_g1_i1.p1  ORF type:complete len:298 (-),score=23.76 TRINITY_DN49990_c0_g1_i1:167-997(-)
MLAVALLLPLVSAGCPRALPAALNASLKSEGFVLGNDDRQVVFYRQALSRECTYPGPFKMDCNSIPATAKVDTMVYVCGQCHSVRIAGSSKLARVYCAADGSEAVIISYDSVEASDNVPDVESTSVKKMKIGQPAECVLGRADTEAPGENHCPASAPPCTCSCWYDRGCPSDCGSKTGPNGTCTCEAWQCRRDHVYSFTAAKQWAGIRQLNYRCGGSWNFTVECNPNCCETVKKRDALLCKMFHGWGTEGCSAQATSLTTCQQTCGTASSSVLLLF